MHQVDIVYKFLSPKHINITQGFLKEDPILLELADVAILQLVDIIDNVSLDDKICGLNSIFFAPEIHGRKAVTPKADVWSIGAILYFLIVNSVM